MEGESNRRPASNAGPGTEAIPVNEAAAASYAIVMRSRRRPPDAEAPAPLPKIIYATNRRADGRARRRQGRDGLRRRRRGGGVPKSRFIGNMLVLYKSANYAGGPCSWACGEGYNNAGINMVLSCSARRYIRWCDRHASSCCGRRVHPHQSRAEPGLVGGSSAMRSGKPELKPGCGTPRARGNQRRKHCEARASCVPTQAAEWRPRCVTWWWRGRTAAFACGLAEAAFRSSFVALVTVPPCTIAVVHPGRRAPAQRGSVFCVSAARTGLPFTASRRHAIRLIAGAQLATPRAGHPPRTIACCGACRTAAKPGHPAPPVGGAGALSAEDHHHHGFTERRGKRSARKTMERPPTTSAVAAVRFTNTSTPSSSVQADGRIATSDASSSTRPLSLRKVVRPRPRSGRVRGARWGTCPTATTCGSRCSRCRLRRHLRVDGRRCPKSATVAVRKQLAPQPAAPPREAPTPSSAAAAATSVRRELWRRRRPAQRAAVGQQARASAPGTRAQRSAGGGAPGDGERTGETDDRRLDPGGRCAASSSSQRKGV